MPPKNTRATNCFTPTDLRKLPVDLRPLGQLLAKNFEFFSDMSKPILEYIGAPPVETYCEFLKKELTGLIDANDSENLGILLQDSSPKDRWAGSSKYLALMVFLEGQEALEAAFLALLKRDVPGYAEHLNVASMALGQVILVNLLCTDEIYQRIGSTSNSLKGASKGGKESAATRRKKSKVPSGPDLKIERQALVQSGKSIQNTVGILAEKYNCSSENIRKKLKEN